jgi:hypothetical protein
VLGRLSRHTLSEGVEAGSRPSLFMIGPERKGRGAKDLAAEGRDFAWTPTLAAGRPKPMWRFLRVMRRSPAHVQDRGVQKVVVGVNPLNQAEGEGPAGADAVVLDEEVQGVLLAHHPAKGTNKILP